MGDDPQAYGYASSLGLSQNCENEVIMQLGELRRQAFDYAARDGRIAADDYFFAEQNARLIANAETYYRAMFAGRAESWNVRDRHMMETLEALLAHLRGGKGARAVVWAHNSIWVTHVRRKWARTASSTLVSSSASAMATALGSSDSRRTRVR